MTLSWTNIRKLRLKSVNQKILVPVYVGLKIYCHVQTVCTCIMSLANLKKLSASEDIPLAMCNQKRFRPAFTFNQISLHCLPMASTGSRQAILHAVKSLCRGWPESLGICLCPKELFLGMWSIYSKQDKVIQFSLRSCIFSQFDWMKNLFHILMKET